MRCVTSLLTRQPQTQELMAGGDLKGLVLEAMARPFDAPYSRADALRWAMEARGAARRARELGRPPSSVHEMRRTIHTTSAI